MEGAMLAEWRSRAGLTQTMLAERLGVDQSYICRIEAGKRRLSARMFARICLVLNVSLEEQRAALEAMAA
jgi:transcriptional regulator with XRE-family HTH domain